MTYILTSEFAAFGQSAPYSPAVEKLQGALQKISTAEAEPLYYPGGKDGAYGLNTHAAFIRVARDYLGWVTGPGCQSICNTLRVTSESACAACIKQALSQFSSIPAAGASFSATEATAVANAYSAFLRDYIASYGDAVGDGGVTMSDDVVPPEADALPPAVDPIPIEEPTELPPDTVLTPSGDALTEGGGEDVFAPSGAQQAGFSWWWLLVGVVAVGGVVGGVYYYSSREDERRIATSPSRYPQFPTAKKLASRKARTTQVVYGRGKGRGRPRAVVSVY